MRSTYLVHPAAEGGWAVRRYGIVRARKHFEKKRDALAYARSIKNCDTISVHRWDGTVQFEEICPIPELRMYKPIRMNTLAARMIWRFANK